MNLRDITEVSAALLARGFLLRSREKEVNIVGWRARNGRVNRFDDLIGIYVRESKEWQVYLYKVTTRPGTKWLLKPINIKGTAILVPGQYKNSFSLGVHKEKRALVQIGPVRVYRDNNGDNRWDKGTIEQGLFGINIHRAGVFSKLVGAWSAGCQVFQREKDFEEFLLLSQRSAEIYGNLFDYTLVEI